VDDLRLEVASAPGFHPGRCAQVLVDDAPIGYVGEIADAVKGALALPGPVVACELDADALLAGRRRPRIAQAVSRFPASTIDLAFVVSKDVPAAALRATLRVAGGELLESVELFDVFRSDALGPDRVSLAFSLRFRAGDRTLTDDEVGALRTVCIAAVVEQFGAELRG